jgi:hypothetical protein
MARIRTVKPEFWSDERMSSVSLEARLLFLGLLNLADDEGRLRGHPSLIRGALFPYDDIKATQVAGWLAQLERAGRVQPYQVDGESYLWVRNFAKHQRIDRPTPSKLPAPPEKSESTRRVLDEPSPSPRDELLRNREGEQGTGKGSREDIPSPTGPAERLLAFWNANAHPQLPRCRAMTSNRKTALRSRLKEHSLEELEEAIRRIGASSFCLGGGSQGWTADLDWMLRPGTVAKVLEGRYDDRGAAAAPAQACTHPGCKAPAVREPYGSPACEEHAQAEERFYRGQEATA